MLIARCRFFDALVFVVAGLLAVAGQAQAAGQRVSAGALAGSSAGWVRLRGNTHPMANAGNDRGAVSGDFPAQRMVMVLERPAAREAALRDFLEQVGNPGSAEYHRYLTPAQFGQRFGLADTDLRRVTGWLEGQGFQVTRTLTGRTGIEFSGSAAQVEESFHTAIHRYVIGGEQGNGERGRGQQGKEEQGRGEQGQGEQGNQGEEHFANASDPEVPAALAGLIAGVTLNNFSPQPMHHGLSRAALDPLSHHATPLYDLPVSNYFPCPEGYCFAVTPGDFATIYDTKPLLKMGVDGSGVTIGIAGVANIDTSIVKRFRQNFLPSYSASNLPLVIVDGPDPGMEDQNALVEAYLDVEEAGSVAPNATVNFYTAANSYVSNGLALAIQRALDDNQVSVLSVSFGECEAYLGTTYNKFYNDLFEQGAAQGMTVLVSTGDSGSAACDPPFNTSGPTQAVSGLYVSGLASSPYVVAVGGTDFSYPANSTPTTLGTYWNTPSASDPNNNADWSSAKSYIPEKVWDISDPAGNQVNLGQSLGAGGGGKSSCIVYDGTDTPGDGPDASLCKAGYPQPDWQKGFTSDTARDLPDVSLFASDGSNYSFTAVCVFDTDCAVPNAGPNSATAALKVTGLGGTSVAAPVMAGMMALVVEKTQSRQGQANAVLYPLSKQKPSAFHDITVGTNRVDCEAGTPDCGSDGFLTGYNAGTGYDLATGLGSIDANVLVNSWSQVTLEATATTLSVTPTNVTHGAAMTFTVDVTAGGKALSSGGDISLLTSMSSGAAEGQHTMTCASFPCTFVYAALPGGSYSVLARYAGSSVYAGSTSAGVPVTIAAEKSEVAVYYQIGETEGGQVSNLNGQTDLTYGRILSFTVVPVPAGYALPADPTTIKATPATGTIQVSDFGVSVGGPLVLDSTGRATFEDFNLPVGKHSLTAAYSGDGSYGASNTVSPLATPLVFTIGKSTPEVDLEPYYQQVLPGSGATVMAYVGGVGSNLPTGTITFTVYTALGAPVKLPPVKLTPNAASYDSSAVVTIPASDLEVDPPSTSQAGSTTVTAEYSGDNNYTPAGQTTAASIYDAKQYSNISLFATPAAPVAGASTALTARVGWTNLLNIAGYPAGSVTFLDGANSLGTAAAVADGYGNGVATLNTSSLGVGTHTITANYAGNAQFVASTATITLTVAPAPPPTPDFTVTASPIFFAKGAQKPTGNSTLTFSMNYPIDSAREIAVSCTSPVQPSAITCATAKTVSVAANANAASGTVTVSIAAVTASSERKDWSGRWLSGAVLAILLPLGLVARRRAWRGVLGLALLTVATGGMVACQSLHFNHVAAGNYQIPVTATMGSVTHQTTVVVTVE